MAGVKSLHAATLIVECYVPMGTPIANYPFGQRHATLRAMLGTFDAELINAPELNKMTPEFYLVLNHDELSDSLADAVYEAGFDDSSLTMRGGQAAVWICHRSGELSALVREALAQAKQGGLVVLHVEIENEVFA